MVMVGVGGLKDAQGKFSSSTAVDRIARLIPAGKAEILPGGEAEFLVADPF